MFRRLFMFAVVAGLALMAQTATAQEATPEGLEAPDPALCTVEPATRERLEAIIAMELVPATPLATSGAGTPVTLPDGEAVSPETQQAVEDAMVINIACINSGNSLLQLAIYTDMGVKRLLGASVTELTDEQFDQLSTPRTVAAEDMTVIHSFGEAIDLGAGRVAIVIVGDDQSRDGEASPTLFVLEEQDGHWYVDSFERTSN